MNFQTKPILPPLKVIFVNSLTPAGQMAIVKILSGKVFGTDQLLDIILLVYSNEKPAAESLALELTGCGFPCFNKIVVSSDLPSISDANVFCFMSSFADPNKIDWNSISNSDEQFDALYLIIKVANNFCGAPPAEIPIDEEVRFKKKQKAIEIIKPLKTIIMADGLVTMDILMSLSKNMPTDIFFCPTVIEDVSKSVLADHLKVNTNALNKILVWAADDNVLHVESEKPLIFQDKIDEVSRCGWDMISKDALQPFADHTQFSPSWMKKEFIEKITSITSKNPYGCIFRASVFCSALKCVWSSRRPDFANETFCNLGVISDGSLGTIKGLPYILPLILRGETWTVNENFKESNHVRGELKRINKAVKERHQKLLPFCKKFFQENVINQAFIPASESSTDYSIGNSSKSSFSEYNN